MKTRSLFALCLWISLAGAFAEAVPPLSDPAGAVGPARQTLGRAVQLMAGYKTTTGEILAADSWGMARRETTAGGRRLDDHYGAE